MAIRTLIIDDHGVLRAGLRALLSGEPDLAIVGEAADGEEGLKKAIDSCPDVILMDVNMPGMDGLETTRRILEQLPAVKVLLLTVLSDNSLLREALNLGASGYILKRAVESELINAIHAVARGDIYIDPAMTRALLNDEPEHGLPSPSAEELTPRENEVLKLIARGYTNRQIGDKLSISIRTVESHRANIMDKLDLHSRVELVRYARENELMD